MQTRTGEAGAEDLGLGNGKLALAQANGQAMDSAQLQDISKMLGFGPSSSGRCCWRS